MRNKIVILMLGVLLSCGGLAQAAPITIEITGEVTTFWDHTGFFNDISVGNVFTGTYTYDSSTPNSDTFSPQRGTYLHNPPCGFNISLGGFEFKTVPSGQLGMQIWDNFNNVFDGYQVSSSENVPLPNGASYYVVSWTLDDYTHTALSSIALPITAPVLSDWGVNSFGIGSGNSFAIGGIVTQAVLVPEPVTVTLMMAGVFLLRRRR
jgi:hypothetical protein